MKRILLIGHRGVGKTSFLIRHASYFPKIEHFDLDREIEEKYGLSVLEIFKQKGEAIFRQYETETLAEILKNNQEYIISLGAGFDLSKLPAKIGNDYKIIFISRETDSVGRIFLDRPDLDSLKSPMQQYLDRFAERQSAYLKHADFIYNMSEGEGKNFDLFEKRIFSESFQIEDAYYTLTEKDLVNIDFYLKSFGRIELRTDLLSSKQILNVIEKKPYHFWLVAFRSGYESSLFDNLIKLDQKNIQLDFEVHLPLQNKSVLSRFLSYKNLILSSHADYFHDGIEQLENFQQKYDLAKASLKLSPKIQSFEDLQKVFDWQQQDKNHRNVLPRSEDGRWIWFRQLAKYNQHLNFVRNRLQLQDQPSLYQWMILPNQKPTFWSAVLGAPIKHSRSPLEHQDFFNHKNTFMTSVLADKDFSRDDLSFLNYLGLKCLAITSPLKEKFYSWSNEKTESANRLKSVNTVFIESEELISDNTDLKGFQSLIDQVKLKFPNLTDKEIIVWGGGGTLKMIAEALPNALFYSASAASPRDKDQIAVNPKILIWAAPRKSEVCWPCEAFPNWKLETIIDINYQENSMGLELAKKLNIPYFSGLEMFKSQAFEQRIFWQKQMNEFNNNQKSKD